MKKLVILLSAATIAFSGLAFAEDDAMDQQPANPQVMADASKSMMHDSKAKKKHTHHKKHKKHCCCQCPDRK